jgi:uncharacterized protein YcfJ
MSKTILRTLTLAVVLSSLPVARAADEVELPPPANSRMSLQLLSPISTATSKKGDKFTCKVLSPLAYAGAIVEGHIRSVNRSGKANKESKIDLAFDNITMPDGRRADLAASVVEVFEVADTANQGRADNEGMVSGRSIKMKTKVKRAATGAIIGGIVGGLVGGGQGAVVGAVIGAGLGVTTTLALKGPDLELKTGTQFTVETHGKKKKQTKSE